MEQQQLARLISDMERLKDDMERHERRWETTVDDIKAIIKSEIHDLKSEQITDLKQAIKDRDQQFAEMENRMRDVEGGVRDWNTGRGILSWLIKLGIGGGSLAAGYLGAKHLG